MNVFAFELTVKDTDWHQIINARSCGAAKARYHAQVLDAWPDIPYTSIRCRKLGPPISSERFKANAIYRGMPALRCGRRVRVGEGRGVIVGHNDSCNFDVLFDDDSPKYAGLTLNVHPQSIDLI